VSVSDVCVLTEHFKLKNSQIILLGLLARVQGMAIKSGIVLVFAFVAYHVVIGVCACALSAGVGVRESSSYSPDFRIVEYSSLHKPWH
jgi:hypothetical protein